MVTSHKGNSVIDALTNGDHLGFVLQMDAAGIEIAIFSDHSIQRGADPSANYGDYLVITSNKFLYLAQVASVRFARPNEIIPMQFGGEPRDIERVARIRLLATYDIQNESVLNGISGAPRTGDSIYAAHQKFVQLVGENSTRYRGQDAGIRLNLAKLSGAHAIPLAFAPEQLFGRHIAVLGTTGGGKSWTVARLVEECAKNRSKVILFDPTGEYHRLDHGTQHVHIGRDPTPHEQSHEVALPYFHLTESDLLAIFKPSGESQGPKLREAMKSLKLARVAAHLAPGGVILKAHRSKVDYQREFDSHSAEIETAYATFDIKKLGPQIENECVFPQSSPVQPLVWGGPSGIDQSNCAPLITRINEIINSPSLACIFNPQSSISLVEVIDVFLRDDQSRILCISMKNVPFAHNVREIITNSIGRYLLGKARRFKFRSQPLLLVVDEAHQFLNEKVEVEGNSFPLDSFSLIAKEGRKFGLNICLATQRPRDIPEGILSQMGTYIVHRLTNELDKEMISSACSELDKSTAASIPALGPGEAVMIGVDFPIPLRIAIEAPVQKPDSSGPNYQKFWLSREQVRDEDTE